MDVHLMQVYSFSEKTLFIMYKVRIPDYSDSISGSIRTIKPDTSGHLVMYFDFT